MRYLGGKTRQARLIVQTMLAINQGSRTHYLEPMIGGCSVLAEAVPFFDYITAGDVVPELVMFWSEIAKGWIPPNKISLEEYNRLKASNDSEDFPMKAWAGFAGSYNGKWFAGYGTTARYLDYLNEDVRATLEKARNLRIKPIDFVSGHYAGHTPGKNTVVYCDPPYFNTEGYSAAGTFDHKRFWKRMDEWHDDGALVFVSEYVAPSHWSPVLRCSRTETVNHKSSGERIDTLFMRK